MSLPSRWRWQVRPHDLSTDPEPFRGRVRPDDGGLQETSRHRRGNVPPRHSRHCRSRGVLGDARSIENRRRLLVFAVHSTTPNLRTSSRRTANRSNELKTPKRSRWFGGNKCDLNDAECRYEFRHERSRVLTESPLSRPWPKRGWAWTTLLHAGSRSGEIKRRKGKNSNPQQAQIAARVAYYYKLLSSTKDAAASCPMENHKNILYSKWITQLSIIKIILNRNHECKKKKKYKKSLISRKIWHPKLRETSIKIVMNYPNG